ncbi:MAG: hypothetical protein ACM3RP_10170 [Chitinophagales bacterium]
MKKLSIVLAVVLALAMVAPVAAAPQLAIAGSLETKFTARSNSVENESFLNLQAGLQGGDKTKAVVILAPWAKPDSVYGTQFWSNGASPVDPVEMPATGNPVGSSFQSGDIFNADFANKIKTMYLQTTGAFWNGGPEATTTIGSISVNESPFVGDLGNRRGIKVEGLKLGPLGVEAFYAPAGGTARILNHDDSNQNPQSKVVNNDSVMGVNLGAQIAGLDLKANVVRSDENKPEMFVSGAMAPVKNLALSAYVLRDRNEDQSVNVGGSYALLPNLTVSASYRKATLAEGQAAVAPLYATRYDVDGNGIVEADEWQSGQYAAFDSKTGVKLGADTTLAGIHVNGSYDMAKLNDNDEPVAKVAADTTLAGFKLNGSVKMIGSTQDDLTWGASRDLQLGSMKVAASYAGERERQGDNSYVVSHEVKAATTLDAIPALKGIALDARVKQYDRLHQNEFEANAVYQAPNGMTFGLHRLVDDSHQTGDTSVTAGLKVQF